mgnify:CR=1 FL=1
MYEKLIIKTHTLQQDQSDCGIACLLSIIQYYGGSNTLEKLRELSGTTKQGTTLLGLYQTANKIGFTAEGNEADLQAIIDHKEPLILHVLIEEKLQHYVICYGYKDNKFIIGDPAKGIIELKKEELESWLAPYSHHFEPSNDEVVGIIMAGNIPLVGFHDLLSVLVTGCTAQIKLSSNDKLLIPALVNLLIKIEPAFKGKLAIVDKLQNYTAIIATGSVNSARYFESYFSIGLHCCDNYCNC